jgi:hypothetical protein
LWWAGGKEREREREREREKLKQDIVPNGIHPVTHFLQRCPISNTPFSHQLIHELIHDEVSTLMIQDLSKAPLAGTKHATHEPLGDISYPNHSSR